MGVVGNGKMINRWEELLPVQVRELGFPQQRKIAGMANPCRVHCTAVTLCFTLCNKILRPNHSSACHQGERQI